MVSFGQNDYSSDLPYETIMRQSEERAWREGQSQIAGEME